MTFIIDKNVISRSKLAEIVGLYVKESLTNIYYNFTSVVPKLAVVLVGDNHASKLYVKKKTDLAKSLGIEGVLFSFSADIEERILIEQIEKLNQDPTISAILVQLPLPAHIDSAKVINAVSYEKDVDGFHVINRGKLSSGDKTAIIPCTPLGCIIILKILYPEGLSGKNACILGRSNIVGKPMYDLLLSENCTVTQLHSKSLNLEHYTTQADILVSAIGKPKMIKVDNIKYGATIIDVGINQEIIAGKKKLCGDVDNCASMKLKAKYITPVPGGVGPMTVACLMLNSLELAFRQNVDQYDHTQGYYIPLIKEYFKNYNIEPN